MLSTGAFVVLALGVFVGAVIQGSVGLGLGLVAAPVTALVEPALMPGVLLWLACVLPVFTLLREWSHVDWSGLGWATAGRVVTVLPGAWIVAAVSPALLGVLVGILVLASVVLTATVVRVPKRRSTLFGAGMVSGITGTATSIGGPPLALVYQHERGTTVRATLAMYFVAGSILSLVALVMTHQLTLRQTTTAALLVPVLAGGFALSSVVTRRLDGSRVRVAVLAVCAAAALALIVRSVV